MRAVIQRVSQSSVVIEGSCCGEIGPGLNILIGIENGDADEDIEWERGCRRGYRMAVP